MPDGNHEDTAPAVVASSDALSLLHGPVDVFNEKELVYYNKLIADSLDVTLSEKQREDKRSHAAKKLKRTVLKRMEDSGDPDAKAANDKLREKARVWMSLSRANAKGKRDAGDQDEIDKHEIELEQMSTLDASYKVARLAGDKKALVAYAIKSKQSKDWKEAKRQERDSNRDMVEVDDEEYMGTKQFFEHDVMW
jgi:hypothetical protein